MTGDASWLGVALVVVGALFVMLVLWRSRSTFRRYRARRSEVTCPANGAAVDCLVEKDLATGITRVERCSAFEDPDAVTCQQICLRQGASKPAANQG